MTVGRDVGGANAPPNGANAPPPFDPNSKEALDLVAKAKEEQTRV
jgi:hypothetical protein